jgi:hypothetical protein
MSYCSIPRLSFAGQFQADVSTVNNDVRHYDNATFEPRFQDQQTRQAANDWWNPSGTGAFRLVNVKVTQAVQGIGQADPFMAGKLYLDAQVQRSAAKLVDLDPQFQMGSMIFGLKIALTDGQTIFMSGNYHPSAFRDLFFGRVFKQPQLGSSGASAKFTSVLTDVVWNDAASASPVLSALRTSAEANDNTLAVNLMTTLFQSGSPFLGTVTGSIGTWKKGQPRSFFAGRRMVVPGGNMATADGIGFFDAGVSGDVLSMDLSNALTFASTTDALHDIGTLTAVVLTTPDTETNINQPGGGIAAGVAQGQLIDASGFEAIGDIDYLSPTFMTEQAGIVDLKVPSGAAGIIGDHPLALITPVPGTPASFKVLIREANAGLYARVDDFEARMDSVAAKSGEPDAVTADRDIYTVRYGMPTPDLPVTVGLLPPTPGSPISSNPSDPQAPTPAIGAPQSAVNATLAANTSGPGGVAPVTIFAKDPGNPRGYIDGQIYQLSYDLALSGISA